MKHHNSPQEHLEAPKAPPVPPNPADAKAFVPAADEVARRAYFAYVNQGSKPGHEVQHWLKAEADLIDERNRTRTHGFHNPT
jgi:hypothetical protein